MEKRTVAYLLVLIVIIAATLRLYHLESAPPGLYPDEAMNGNNLLEAIHTGDYKVFYPENNGREGLFMNIQSFFVSATGLREPWVLRLPSALFGILTVLGLYFLAKELFSKEVGLLASFFLATSVWHIIFSRIGFRAIMAPAFAVWGIYLLLRAMKRWKFGENSFVYATIGGVVYGLGFYSYIAYRVTPVLVLFIMVFFLVCAKEHKHFLRLLRNCAVFAFSALLVVLPLGMYFATNPGTFFGRTSQVSVFAGESPVKDLTSNILKTAQMFNFEGDGNARHNPPGRSQLFWPVGMLFIIGIIAGLIAIFRNRWRRWLTEDTLGYWTMFLWFGLAAAPVVISNEGLPHALRAILMIPPAVVFAALGGRWLYRILKPRLHTRFLKPILYFLLTLLILEAFSTYFVLWARNPETAGAFNQNYVDLGHELNTLPDDLPKYVIVEAGGGDVRGLPMPTQTVMFLTDTFLPEQRAQKNIYYILPGEENKIPPGAYTAVLR